MALRAGYKGFKTLGQGLEYDNTTGHLALKGEENPHSLENLSDVSITEPAAEDVLLYDPSEEEWINDDLSNTAAVMAKVDKSDIAPVLSEAVAPEGGLDPKDQFYLDNILYEATTTIAQGTAIVTSGTGQNCEVAPSVTGQIAEQEQLLEDTVGYTAENIINYMNSFVVYNNNVKITYSSATKKTTIVTDGTASANVYQQPSPSSHYTEYQLYPHGVYELACDKAMPTGLSLQAYVYKSDGTANGSYTITVSNSTSIVLSEDNYIVVRFGVNSGASINGDFEAIIKRASVDKIKVDNSVIGNVEDGATASQAYAVGKFFIRNSKFCKAKTAIDQGDTFTLNTNYEETSIADVLYGIMNS